MPPKSPRPNKSKPKPKSKGTSVGSYLKRGKKALQKTVQRSGYSPSYPFVIPVTTAGEPRWTDKTTTTKNETKSGDFVKVTTTNTVTKTQDSPISGTNVVARQVAVRKEEITTYVESPKKPPQPYNWKRYVPEETDPPGQTTVEIHEHPYVTEFSARRDLPPDEGDNNAVGAVGGSASGSGAVKKKKNKKAAKFPPIPANYATMTRKYEFRTRLIKSKAAVGEGGIQPKDLDSTEESRLLAELDEVFKKQHGNVKKTDEPKGRKRLHTTDGVFTEEMLSEIGAFTV